VVKVKICGITNKEDAFFAVDFGADALGFIFYPLSPRNITPLQAKKIIKMLPPFIDRVGVFVNENPLKVKEISSFCGLTTLQFHGDESPSYCSFFPCYKVIKSFSIKDRLPSSLLKYRVDAILLDAFCEGKRGGTGKTFRWDLALEVKDFGFPLIISGGLSPGNVRGAIEKVRPYAVDVASGVEEKPGKKSKDKLREFILKVRECDEKL